MGFPAGEQGLTLVDTEFGRFAVLICQDIYYPELWEAAHAAHVDVLIWPSALEGSGKVQVSGETLVDFFPLWISFRCKVSHRTLEP